ncbi:unnamed protein product [Protopolystoma xenopodis]|uniref:Uncharacterized protein n=1 Tax=Protopolystoma xenopodis TaxID=117903 RepID=A0A3S5A2Y3_9PLAT|nr:unnamed protein product [Protopolystoma xenopodis]
MPSPSTQIGWQRAPFDFIAGWPTITSSRSRRLANGSGSSGVGYHSIGASELGGKKKTKAENGIQHEAAGCPVRVPTETEVLMRRCFEAVRRHHFWGQNCWLTGLNERRRIVNRLALVIWVEITGAMGHVGAIFYKTTPGCESWMMDSTEGVGRQRRRLTACRLLLAPRFLQQEGRNKLARYRCPNALAYLFSSPMAEPISSRHPLFDESTTFSALGCSSSLRKPSVNTPPYFGFGFSQPPAFPGCLILAPIASFLQQDREETRKLLPCILPGPSAHPAVLHALAGPPDQLAEALRERPGRRIYSFSSVQVPPGEQFLWPARLVSVAQTWSGPALSLPGDPASAGIISSPSSVEALANTPLEGDLVLGRRWLRFQSDDSKVGAVSGLLPPKVSTAANAVEKASNGFDRAAAWNNYGEPDEFNDHDDTYGDLDGGESEICSGNGQNESCSNEETDEKGYRSGADSGDDEDAKTAQKRKVTWHFFNE